MFYPEKINHRFQKPQNAGKLETANAVGTEASFLCGAFVRVFLEIDVQTKVIRRIKFKTDGCGYLIAAADVLAEKIKWQNLTTLHGPAQLETEIKLELGEFPAARRHCLEISLNAFKSALADFRAFQLEEFTGEKALICTCFGVSEERIEKIIAETTALTVEEVGAICFAGTGCGSCRFLIQELIDIQTRV